MPCFQSTHNLYCSQRPYSGKLTAHPVNQLIGSKDDDPAFVEDHVAPATARGLFSPYLLDEICGLCSRGIDLASAVLWLQNALKTIIMLIAVRRALHSKMKQPGEQPGVARSSQENTRSSQEQPGEQPGAARSIIFQQKTTVINGWGIVFNEKTTVIHGWDIKKLSPAYDFFKNNSSYIGNFQRMYVFPRQDSKK